MSAIALIARHRLEAPAEPSDRPAALTWTAQETAAFRNAWEETSMDYGQIKARRKAEAKARERGRWTYDEMRSAENRKSLNFVVTVYVVGLILGLLIFG